MLDNTPILISSAQVTVRETPEPADCASAMELASRAVTLALDSAGITPDAIDTLIMTRLFYDCVEGMVHPFGSSTKPPLSVAQRTGITPQRAIYGTEGGQSPQRLVNECAEAIYAGEMGSVVICGGEAIAAVKQAKRNGWTLDWQEDPAGEIEDRGFNMLMSDLEVQHHITFPTQVYALFENAWRYRQGLTVAEHRQLMAKLFSRFSEIAANNEYAQFPIARSEAFLAESSPENYAFNEPYHKWMIAQDAVNQAAAVIMTSCGRARALGIPESQWVFLHGYGDADDIYPSHRAELAASPALQAAGEQALGMANCRIDDIAFLDLYSCFPIAVLAARDALGIAPEDERDLTVTGGLPFFGGPGNSYSLNAIAQMYQMLTSTPDAFGLISANGGFLSKESVGIYSNRPVGDWRPVAGHLAQDKVDALPRIEVANPYEGPGTIETYCVVYRRSQPALGLAMCREPAQNRRVLVKVATDDLETLEAMIAREPIGRSVAITRGEDGCYFRFAEGA